MRIYTRVTPGTSVRLGLFGWLIVLPFVLGALMLYGTAVVTFRAFCWLYGVYKARKRARERAELRATLRRQLAAQTRYVARHARYRSGAQWADERPTVEFPAVR